MPEFLPGIELSRLLYEEIVRPLLGSAYPGLRYSAALIGPGSEVLGFDSARSTDHDWGPRLQLFLPGDPAGSGLAGEITDLLARRLPAAFRGWPVAFDDSSGRHGVRHWVSVAGLGAWLTGALGFDPRRGVTLLDWLATPTQRLAEITAGAVFRDGLAGDPAEPGGLAAVRAALAWYPPDVWRYYTRPYLVLGAGRFAAALLASITDPAVTALPPCGTADQFTDGVGVLGDLTRLRALVIATRDAHGV
jgi:Domain of unknown function (DUF4037)